MKRHLILLVLILSAAVVLGACADNKTPGNSSPNASSDTPADPDAQPAAGGRLVYGMTQDLASLDPHQTTDAGTRSVVFNLYEGLVKPTADGDLEPAVASDYVISDDATTYTFTLRDGIRFHDGSLVTVEDIQYSIERYAEIQGESSAFFMRLSSVETPDEKTVVVRLKEGYSEFLPDLTLAIIPKSNPDPAGNPIGTGPYQFVSYTIGQNLELSRFKDYWKENGAYLDTVQFKFVADLSTAFTELQAGTIDVLNYLTVAQVAVLEKKPEDFTIVEGSMNLVHAMFINNAYEPFQDVRVRQAMCYAVNRQEVNDFLFGGKSRLIGSHMIPSLAVWYEEKAENLYSYDPQKAKELLAQAGYENGFELEITVPSSYSQHVDTAQIIAQQLEQVGIRVKIKTIEWASWLEDVYRGRQYQATVIGFDGTLAPSDWLKKYGTNEANNIANYANTDYDALLKKALASIDNEEKAELYRSMQMNLAENAASVYIEDPADFVALNADFGGYQFYPTSAWDVSCIYQKAK